MKAVLKILLSVILTIMVIAMATGIPAGLVLIALKLFNIINWGWLIVCLPFICWAVALFIYIVITVFIVGE